MSRFERILLVLTCIGGFASGIVVMLEKWRAIPVRVQTVEREVVRVVPATIADYRYCEAKFCVYATPDGLRVENYTSHTLDCSPVEWNLKEAGAGPGPDSAWWAIGRPGPFMKCVER